jgi:hypothetical protein
MPEDPGALRSYALERIPELIGTRTREEVESRLEELPELRANHIRGYLEGVELSGPAARMHECFVALELDTSSQRVARQCKRIGRGDVQRGACQVLMRGVAELEERLETSLDLRVHGHLSPRALAKLVRTHFYPAARLQRTRLEQNGAPTGEHRSNAGMDPISLTFRRVPRDGDGPDGVDRPLPDHEWGAVASPVAHAGRRVPVQGVPSAGGPEALPDPA